MTFNENTKRKTDHLAKLVVKKQKDYGVKNILNSPVDPRLGIIIRLNDKLQRAAHLIQKGKIPENESLIDTWKDIAGYGLIGWMVEDDTFELELDDERI